MLPPPELIVTKSPSQIVVPTSEVSVALAGTLKTVISANPRLSYIPVPVSPLIKLPVNETVNPFAPAFDKSMVKVTVPVAPAAITPFGTATEGVGTFTPVVEFVPVTETVTDRSLFTVKEPAD